MALREKMKDRKTIEGTFEVINWRDNRDLKGISRANKKRECRLKCLSEGRINRIRRLVNYEG